MTQITSTEIDFLEQSNNIEGVFDEQSLDDALKAWQYLKKQKELTIPVILKTHLMLMKNQALKKSEIGKFRTIPIYIGSKEGLRFDKLTEALLEWIGEMNIAPYVGGKQFMIEDMFKRTHIKYEKIHPFVDGNGRTGRMFMNWQRLKAGLPILVIWNNEKQAYYKWFV